jgi:phosphoadenosine phosphosulfate reductase
VPFPPLLQDLTAEEMIGWALRSYGRSFCVCTSFQDEGMVLVDMAARIDSSVRVITLDTGRLPKETYEMIERVREHYSLQVDLVSPDAEELGRMTTRFGPNLFYRGVAERRLCCHIRKVRPLERALAGFAAVAFGVRREQSETRAALPRILEEEGGRLRLHPLAEWSAAQVLDYLRAYDVPRHPLYERGYRSIGCDPCTRPVQPGEHERAGRWWWEQDAAKECGLHQTPDGRLRREIDVLLEQVLERTPADAHRLH